jgi:hypothetical protein
MRPIIFLLVSFTLIAQAQAVTMREAIEECYYDGRKKCPNLGHGAKMQDCLTLHFMQLSPGCQKIVIRLNHGETITLF